MNRISIIALIVLISACHGGDNLKPEMVQDALSQIDASTPITVPDAEVTTPDAAIDSGTAPICVSVITFANLAGLMEIATRVDCSGTDTVSTVERIVVSPNKTVLTVTHSGVICGQVTSDKIDTSSIAPSGFSVAVNYFFDSVQQLQECDVIGN